MIRFFILVAFVTMLPGCATQLSPRLETEKESGLTQEITRPPNDDSEKSTVRVTTAWTVHKLDMNGCLARAATVLAYEKYFVDPTEVSVYGLKEGITVSFRCDYEGVVFVVVAHRKRPDQATQDRIIIGLRDAFAIK